MRLRFKRLKVKGDLELPEVERGKVTYTVQSQLNPVTFKRLKDAKQFKELLAVSENHMPSDIVRREITKEGFEIGDENV